MAVSLTRESYVGPGKHPESTDNVMNMNRETIKCSKCGQNYILGYSIVESTRLDEWRIKAHTLVNNSHEKNHDSTTLQL